MRLPGLVPLTIPVFPVLLPTLQALATRRRLPVEAYVARLVEQAVRLKLRQASAGRRAAGVMTPEQRRARAQAAARARWHRP